MREEKKRKKRKKEKKREKEKYMEKRYEGEKDKMKIKNLKKNSLRWKVSGGNRTTDVQIGRLVP